MPGFDGTGPQGMGAMTGGGFGRCADPTQRTYGRGMGRGRGRGLRQRSCWTYYPPQTPEQVDPGNEILKRDADFLKARISDLENSLTEINKKLETVNRSADNTTT
jgi:hypothetical protein